MAAAIACAQACAESEALEEVIVLAQKRAAPLQHVPVAISTLTAADLAAQGLGDIGDVAARSPMLDFQESVTAATTTLRVRRIGNLGNIPTFEPAVGLFVDGAFRSRSLFASGELLDVERIEILRGPQTALYGKNVSAGVLALYTRRPGERFSASAEASGGWLDAPGSPGLASLKATASGPLSGTLQGSLAVGGAWHDFAAQNMLEGAPDGNEMARSSARGQLLWASADSLELRLIAGLLSRDSHEGESDVVYVPGARSTLLLESLQGLGLTGTCPDNSAHNRRSCAVAANHLDLDAADATLTATYRLDNGWTIHSLTSYEHYRDRRDEDDAVQLLAPLLFFHDSEEADSWQEELRLASADDAHVRWLAGLFLYESDYERGTRGRRPMFGPNGDLAFDPFWVAALGIPLAIPGQDGLHDSRLSTEYASAFGLVTLPLGERWSVDAAVRWAQEEKRASIANAVTQAGVSVVSALLTPPTSPGGEPVNGTVRRESDVVTWELSPQFRIDDNRLLFATWGRGGKFGGFNTSFGSAPLAAREFGDETIDHYELGGRFTLDGGRARLGVSAFRTDYHDFQDAAFASAQFTIGNAELARLEGAELEAEILLGADTRANLALSYADLRYERNTNGMCYPGRVPDGSTPGSCDLAGEHPVLAPEWQVQLGVEQAFTVGSLAASARLDWSWSDRYNTSFSADPRLVQPGYHGIGARISLRLNENVTIVLSGENLLDETITYFDSVLNFFNDASYQSYLAEPRRFALTLRAEL
jgi:outer membrane receptor protein involved in Fe transport